MVETSLSSPTCGRRAVVLHLARTLVRTLFQTQFQFGLVARWMLIDGMKCVGKSINDHPVLMAKEAKIAYSPCELAVKCHLECVVKGSEVVSEGMVMYLKENSCLA